MRSRALLVVALLALVVPLGAGGCGDRSPAPPPDRIGRFPRSQFYMEHDRFLPAVDPAMLRADQAAGLLPEDEVFGVVIAGEARAYPITMMAYHHVVNDVIQGIPIAVTY